MVHYTRAKWRQVPDAQMPTEKLILVWAMQKGSGSSVEIFITESQPSKTYLRTTYELDEDVIAEQWEILIRP